MKKLVLVVAMFMFVCGGSFLVKAQNSEKAATAQSEVNAALIVIFHISSIFSALTVKSN